jgi:hypothetical protein
MTDIYKCFPQFLQANVRMVPRLGHDHSPPNTIYFIIYQSTYHLTLYYSLDIVTCGPFLGNELANMLPWRDLFLETNCLWNMVSMNTKTESCKQLETRLLLQY